MSDKVSFNGKLGVEMITTLKGCCVDTILAWRPQLIGQKARCLYCDNPLKSVRAGEIAAPEWTGMLNECSKEIAAPDLVFGEIWFSKKRFADAGTVSVWCSERGVESGLGISQDDMAFKVKTAEVVPGTERVLWAAPGVVAVAGVAKQAMGMGDMAAAGVMAPAQGAKPGLGDIAMKPEGDDKTTEEPSQLPKELLAAFNMRLDALVRRA